MHECKLCKKSGPTKTVTFETLTGTKVAVEVYKCPECDVRKCKQEHAIFHPTVKKCPECGEVL